MRKGVQYVVPEERHCEVCGTAFLVGGNSGAHRTKRFCSYRCVNVGTARHGYSWPRLDATEEPSRDDIILAAGWWEGEGHVRWGTKQQESSLSGTLILTVTQKDPWLLERLRALFGGSITTTRRKYRGRPYVMGAWRVAGLRANQFADAIYGYLSPRRQRQVDAARAKQAEHRQRPRATGSAGGEEVVL